MTREGRRGPAIIARPPPLGTTPRSRFRVPKPPRPALQPSATTSGGGGEPGGGVGRGRGLPQEVAAGRRRGGWLHFRKGGGGGAKPQKGRGDAGSMRVRLLVANFHPSPLQFPNPCCAFLRTHALFILCGSSYPCHHPHPVFSPLPLESPVNARVHTPGNAFARDLGPLPKP